MPLSCREEPHIALEGVMWRLKFAVAQLGSSDLSITCEGRPSHDISIKGEVLKKWNVKR